MDHWQTGLALLIAIGIPTAFLLLVYFLDLYASRTFRLVVVCFGWGAVGGVGLALLINTYIAVPFIRMVRPDLFLLYVVFAPVIEEIAKSLPLFYVRRRPEFTYFVDGAIYGFAAGIGFSITESFLYIRLYPSVEIPLALVRGFSTCLMHGAATALVGAAIGYFRFQRFGRRRLLLVGGWIAAILLHALFNAAVLALHTRAALGVAAATAIGLSGLAAVILFIYRGLREERKWLLESLDQKMVNLVDADLTSEEQMWLAEILDREEGVTTAEVRASQVYEFLDDFLKPIALKFPRKAELVDRIVLQQAQIGIKRKIERKTNDPKLRKKLVQEIARLKEDTKQLRREAGVCAMTYVQCVFDEEGADIIPCVENILACAEEHDRPPS